MSLSSSSTIMDKISSIFSSKPVQFALTAILASGLTGFGILYYQSAARRDRAKKIKQELLHSHEPRDLSSSTRLTEYGTAQSKFSNESEDLIREQLSRNISFLGEEGMQKLRGAFVVVVGAGGVGSWAALMLARSGIGKLRLVDFDQVTLSSLNRHAVATRADVGIPKVEALQKRIAEIAPFVSIEARVELFNKNNAEDIFSGNPDYIIDAIDNIDTKLDLIKYCYDHKLTVISSMGAGAKADPSRIQITDISETLEDPLARSVRRRLRKMGVESGIPVVYSTEKPHHVRLLPLDENMVEDADEFATLPDFRVRILPVLGTLPSMFGMALATYIILKLANFPVEPLSIKLRDALYQRLHRDLKVREEKMHKEQGIPLDLRDVGYIFEEIWRGRSAVSGSMEKLALTRWNHNLPLSLQNCVCMTKREADIHDKLTTPPEEYYPTEVLELVKRRFAEERAVGTYR
ncbi:uncharacterized protein VTP21DRAFT_5113 [Calcarisporiella thermophila]|uniref:uncharacterized protein n=1 Tax=Calcarisporiella thermophila TaxID=911321 RepID=UPI0037449D14